MARDQSKWGISANIQTVNACLHTGSNGTKEGDPMSEQRGRNDVLIIGQGATAFSAGLYAARYQLKPLLFGD